ncbi:hypothetical protein [Streptomyces albus]|uniref:hypothetical protein n=1 Tax=Streptomyces albus TaxID=1888 RepID=UPI00068B9709|nr:hypothetical protein [Streptomyces albus]
MIVPNQRFAAAYRHEGSADGKTHTHYTSKAVVGWDDDGTPLVVDEKTGRLRDASSWRNYAGVHEGEPAVIAALPGNGWRAEYRNDDGSVHSSPIVAWLVYDDGSVKPADTDGDAYVDFPTTVSNFTRIYHPTETEEAP